MTPVARREGCMCEMLHLVTQTVTVYSWVLLGVHFLSTIIDGDEEQACMCVRGLKNMNVRVLLPPSRSSVYKDNLTPANAVTHVGCECAQV